MIDLYNLSFHGRPISAEEKQWIIQGSSDEDSWPRWVNHFYDPVYNQGWTAEGFGKFSSSTGRWLSTILLSDHPPLASKYWAQSPSTQSEYKDFGGNRTWQRALSAFAIDDRQVAFYTLGHILHLLEDATVPEHTRNDTHAHPLHLFTSDDGSPYEKYAKRYFVVGNKTNIPNNAASLLKAGLRPISRSTLTAYFNFLATYSNNYFFSKDTVLIPKYALPIIFHSDNDYGYGKDIDGIVFPLARKVTQRKADFSWATAFVLNDILVDKVILEAYFDRLSRAAIQNGAGAIKLFFNQVTQAQTTEQPTETAGVRSVLADLTEVKNNYKSISAAVEQVVPKAVVESVAKPIVEAVIDAFPLASGLAQVLGEKIFAEPSKESDSFVTVAPAILPYFGGTGGGGGVVQTIQPVVDAPIASVLPAVLPIIPPPIIVFPPTSTDSVENTTENTTTTLDVVTTTPEIIDVVTITPPVIATSTSTATTATTTTTTTTTIPTTTAITTTPDIIVSSTSESPCSPVSLNGRQETIDRVLTKVGCPYLLGYYEIPIGATLRMEPGVVVKAIYADAKIDIFGSLVVGGSSNESVVLTSGRDKETVNGEVFGNWSGADPHTKDWQGLWFHPHSTGVLNNLTMRYAGKNFRVNNLLYTSFVSQAIRIENAEVQFDGGRFEYDGDVVVRSENSSITILNSAFSYGGKAIESLTSAVTINGVSFDNFSDLRGPVLLRDNWPSLQDVVLTNNTADVVYVEAATVTSTVTLTSDVVYYLNNSMISAEGSMTVESGSLVYMADNSSLQINGMFVAEGTDERRIHFKPFDDKTFWGALQFNAGRGRISHVVFEGGNYNFPRPAERSGMLTLLNGSDVVINNSVIGDRRSPGNSIYVESSVLVVNNSSIAQDEKSSFSNNGITVDQGTLNLSNVLFANLTMGIKIISLPVPDLAFAGLSTENIDNLLDPPGILSL